MLDSTLCRLFHKKEVTIGDIFWKLTVLIACVLLLYGLYKNTIMVGFYIVFILITLVFVILLLFGYVLLEDLVFNKKIAECKLKK